MRKYIYLAFDLACVCTALLVALYLRHGFPLIQDFSGPHDLRLLLCVTFITSLIVLPLMHTNTSMWRYTSTADLANVMIAVALVVLITDSSLFLISRLEMMPRSVPPMHWAIAVMAMGGSRLMARQLFGPTRRRTRRDQAMKQHVVVVGAGHTAELYLQFIKRIVQHEVVVEGFVDSDKTLTNRIFQKHKILGTPGQLPQLLEEFLVHGIHIRQVVLAQLLDELPQAERDLLLALEEKQLVELVHFGKHMDPQLQPRTKQNDADFYEAVQEFGTVGFEKPRGFYPYVKRLFDLFGGLALLIVLSPLLVTTALIVALDVGFPLLFWQQRPGRHGKPFRLYKFRTMRHAGRRHDEDRLSHKSGDTVRTSAIGKILRRLRFDELPQLFHIIAGTMSFVGPRPLLPDDQPEAGQVRLSVRPGVSGWAQIHGGDALTPAEKLVLDVWYIRNMSLWLDVRILLRTLLVVLKEDKRRIERLKTS